MLRITFALLAFGLLSTAHAAEGTDNCTGTISALPATISSPGIWCLRKHLATAITSGAAITIAADDVILDCNDFKVGGLPGYVNTNTVGILANDRLNTTIRHCVIRGFIQGIRLAGNASGGLIEGNRLDQNTVDGISVSGSGHTIRRNRILDTGGRPASMLSSGIASTADFTRIMDNAVMHETVAGSDGGVVGISSLGNACEVSWNYASDLVPNGSGEAVAIDLGASTGSSIHRNQLVVAVALAGTAIRSGTGNQCGSNSFARWGTGIVGCRNAGSNFGN